MKTKEAKAMTDNEILIYVLDKEIQNRSYNHTEKKSRLQKMVKKLKNGTPAFAIVSGRSDDFESDLFNLINRYVSNGLSKPDLVSKMKYVTGSCEMS